MLLPTATHRQACDVYSLCWSAAADQDEVDRGAIAYMCTKSTTTKKGNIIGGDTQGDEKEAE